MANKALTKKANELAKQGSETTEPSYKLAPKEDLVVGGVIQKFEDSKMERDLSFEYFDDRNLITYINDSVKRYTTNIDVRDDI